VPEAARSTAGLRALFLPQRGKPWPDETIGIEGARVLTPRGRECNLGRVATENSECGNTVIRRPLSFVYAKSPASSRPACRITSHKRGSRGGRIPLRTRGLSPLQGLAGGIVPALRRRLLAYCLMPDHVHLILTPGDSAGLMLARGHWLLTRALSMRGCT
jgi:hypothetical protein